MWKANIKHLKIDKKIFSTFRVKKQLFESEYQYFAYLKEYFKIFFWKK